jgi:peptidoglycan hydrolase-like protein with peptidoglycan-binding domain
MATVVLETLTDIIGKKLVLALNDAKKEPSLIREIQANLFKTEDYAGQIDGIWGPRTEQAFYSFCKKADLNCPVTGLIGPTFAAKLLHPELFDPWLEAKDRDSFVRAVVREAKKQGISSRCQIAYIIATVQHETAGTFQPICEYGGKYRPYSPYYGRGYVQLTWQSNYEKYKNILGIDLVGQPDLALVPETAGFILVHGMINGTFTGQCLANFISDSSQDYYNARTIVNGYDRASLIASYAKTWENNKLLLTRTLSSGTIDPTP